MKKQKLFDKKISIINGPNLNLLGVREPKIYGKTNFSVFFENLKQEYLFKNLKLTYNQSNHEGDLINQIHVYGFDHNVYGIILNAGAYSHTSLALFDAIKSIDRPVIEVHITNIYSREYIRTKSLISPACKGVICGFGLNSYKLAIISLLNKY